MTTTSPYLGATLAVPALALLAACGTRKPPIEVTCMHRVKPVGSYASVASDKPVFVPAEGGTQEGADALNRCVEEVTAG